MLQAQLAEKDRQLIQQRNYYEGKSQGCENYQNRKKNILLVLIQQYSYIYFILWNEGKLRQYRAHFKRQKRIAEAALPPRQPRGM